MTRREGRLATHLAKRVLHGRVFQVLLPGHPVMKMDFHHLHFIYSSPPARAALCPFIFYKRVCLPDHLSSGWVTSRGSLSEMKMKGDFDGWEVSSIQTHLSSSSLHPNDLTGNITNADNWTRSGLRTSKESVSVGDPLSLRARDDSSCYIRRISTQARPPHRAGSAQGKVLSGM